MAHSGCAVILVWIFSLGIHCSATSCDLSVLKCLCEGDVANCGPENMKNPTNTEETCEIVRCMGKITNLPSCELHTQADVKSMLKLSNQCNVQLNNAPKPGCDQDYMSQCDSRVLSCLCQGKANCTYSDITPPSQLSERTRCQQVACLNNVTNLFDCNPKAVPAVKNVLELTQKCGNDYNYDNCKKCSTNLCSVVSQKCYPHNLLGLGSPEEGCRIVQCLAGVGDMSDCEEDSRVTSHLLLLFTGVCTIINC